MTFAFYTTIYAYILQHDDTKLHLNLKTFAQKRPLLIVGARYTKPKQLYF